VAEQDERAAPFLSVVVPTFNSCARLEGFLRQLHSQLPVGAELVVVDDASSDGTEAVLAEAWHGARVVRLERNRGFAGAINAGIRAARGRLLFLLNDDVYLAPGALAILLRAAEAGDADILGPLLLFADDPGRIYAAGDRILPGGRPESVGFRAERAGAVITREVFGITAGAALIHRRVFDKIGLFDERFVAYFEDADLCFRARLAGFRACLVVEAEATHIGGASLGRRRWWRSVQCYRNHALIVLKNFPGRLLVRHLPAILLERRVQAGQCFSAARTEFGALRAWGMLWRARISLLAMLPGVLRARARIQRGRRCDVAEIAGWLRR